MSFSMHTNGKLLLTGEYFVTDGAVALALPTQLGQSLEVATAADNDVATLQWKSLDQEGNCWFEATFSLPAIELQDCAGGEDKDDVAENLQELLKEAQAQNPEFLNTKDALVAQTTLDFDRAWGLGTSATLVKMVAEWAQIDAFQLLKNTFGGSGYDIVTTTAEGPMLFQKFNGNNRWDKSNFNPTFKDNLYFVYLNQKQDSKEALVHYIVTPEDERTQSLPRITQITYDIAKYTDNIHDFNTLLEEHESLVQEVIKQPRAKELYFEDYWGEIKSLGGWGGDFVLATSDKSEEETKAYFQEKGFDTVFKYTDLIKEY